MSTEGLLQWKEDDRETVDMIQEHLTPGGNSYDTISSLDDNDVYFLPEEGTVEVEADKAIVEYRSWEEFRQDLRGYDGQ
ncbi:MAG: hypothetical protein ABEJ64_02925 [Candidatus Nanohaloarchaea archaeon]